ncbi:dihydrodipicolinate synthase family protein [Caldisericum exile]|uniref:Dihydrodipicolinate synthase n=1 Tax=Caldisericum exile (strain DSM 21853 / NBRC 104410 / AZM16c01) TaxID=511051 RepID=A0A7U6GES5_CALEA|nr:dihydrodipicolinate synthase family protein [Caldisericum exile]BAL81046.1 dihydrodipicolinate synthase [Caldisericum exile AZM16c01]
MDIKNIVALITPFKEDGAIDYQGFEKFLDYLTTKSPDGLFANATTGEFTNLSLQEKKNVALFVKKNSKDIPVYVNVHSTVFEETLEMCEFAKEGNFYAIVSPPPFFLVPSQRGLYDYFIKIAETSELPTFIYNIPALTGYSLSVDLIKELAKHPLIKGIKVTYDNMGYLVRLVNEVKAVKSDFEIFTGTEQLYVPLIVTGGDGGVMALANIALDIFNEVKAAFIRRDLEKVVELHKKITRLTYIYNLTTSFGYAIKVALGFMNIPIERYVRRPLMEDSFNEEEFRNILKGVGLI